MAVFPILLTGWGALYDSLFPLLVTGLRKGSLAVAANYLAGNSNKESNNEVQDVLASRCAHCDRLPTDGDSANAPMPPEWKCISADYSRRDKSLVNEKWMMIHIIVFKIVWVYVDLSA